MIKSKFLKKYYLLVLLGMVGQAGYAMSEAEFKALLEQGYGLQQKLSGFNDETRALGDSINDSIQGRKALGGRLTTLQTRAKGMGSSDEGVKTIEVGITDYLREIQDLQGLLKKALDVKERKQLQTAIQEKKATLDQILGALEARKESLSAEMQEFLEGALKERKANLQMDEEGLSHFITQVDSQKEDLERRGQALQEEGIAQLEAALSSLPQEDQLPIPSFSPQTLQTKEPASLQDLQKFKDFQKAVSQRTQELEDKEDNYHTALEQIKQQIKGLSAPLTQPTSQVETMLQELEETAARPLEAIERGQTAYEELLHRLDANSKDLEGIMTHQSQNQNTLTKLQELWNEAQGLGDLFNESSALQTLPTLNTQIEDLPTDSFFPPLPDQKEEDNKQKVRSVIQEASEHLETFDHKLRQLLEKAEHAKEEGGKMMGDLKEKVDEVFSQAF